MTFQTPPRTKTDTGDERRVGLELEFGGLSGDEALNAILNAVGGRSYQPAPHRYRILDSRIGNLTLELDTRLAQPKNDTDEPDIVSAARTIIGSLAKTVVPFEVVTEPLPFQAIPIFDRIVEGLRDAGAKGSSAHPAYAFGLHFNPEAPSTETSYLLSILRAHVLLNDTVRARSDGDLSRHLMGWARPYPDEFATGLLDAAYQPSFEKLVHDYVAFMPNRNYDLDMLPLFASIDEDLVSDLVKDPLLRPRPTFHFRLPVSQVDDPDWSIAEGWNSWMAVERLAENLNAIEHLSDSVLIPQTRENGRPPLPPERIGIGI
ncbi:MAG: amidoligase family protein [Pseudomonadota bacterium]